MEEITYGTNEMVYDVARVKETTFNSWLIRGYLPLPPGPGTGRIRRYTMLDAIRIAAFANITSHGISPAIASDWVPRIGRIPRHRDFLVCVYDNRRDYHTVGVVNWPANDGDVHGMAARLEGRYGAPSGMPSIYTLDLHRLAEQVAKALTRP